RTPAPDQPPRAPPPGRRAGDRPHPRQADERTPGPQLQRHPRAPPPALPPGPLRLPPGHLQPGNARYCEAAGKAIPPLADGPDRKELRAAAFHEVRSIKSPAIFSSAKKERFALAYFDRSTDRTSR